VQFSAVPLSFARFLRIREHRRGGFCKSIHEIASSRLWVAAAEAGWMTSAAMTSAGVDVSSSFTSGPTKVDAPFDKIDELKAAIQLATANAEDSRAAWFLRDS
jgi:hypothetical protein